MKTIAKSLFAILLGAALIFGSVLPCFAAEPKGVINIELEDKDKNPVNDIKINICQIAALNNSGYYPTEDFENSGISVSAIINNPSAATAKSIAEYIKSNGIVTDSALPQKGKVSFADLELGIWLVFPEENSKFSFNPYIVLLPFESGGKLYYEVTSVPKLEDSAPNEINIYVIKKWDDKSNAAKKRPDSVTVELLNGETVISTVELNEENGWAYTFKHMPKDGNYSVKEKAVADYKATYSGDTSNGFVITNTYDGEKLPQTGQYWWPIILIAVAGAGFILLGIYEIGAKKNGKKK